MSNTKNLASLAAVLDDGTSGQVLQSTGSGGVQFADSTGSGVTVHANQAAMLTDAASADEGTLHYETGTNKLYVKQSSGFYLLASITNASPTIDSFSENTGGAGANNLTAGGTFTLTAGSNTVVTINATEPDLETISYSATVTSGTATDVFSSPSFPVTNQSSNVFTLTPVTSGTGGTVTIRFDASDGTNVANVSHSFEIAFVIADSHYTSLLMATDGSAGDNNDITDSSSSNHTITVNGDAHAGTFSPYRHGGYSTYFDGNDYLAVTKSTDLDLDTNNWTIECWLNLTNPSATQAVYSFGYETQTTRGCIIYLYGGNLHFAYSTTGSNNTDTSMGSHGIVANEWTHLSVVRNGSTITGYINGSALGTTINIGASDIYYPSSGNVRIGGDGTNFVTGYISDFRLVNGTATAPASGGPTERLTAVTNTKLLACHLPYFADGSSSAHSITINGDPETKPFGPYDYQEYSESTNGGSVYLDGTGDYLSASYDASFNLGTGAFTWEAWVYPTTISGFQGLYGTNGGGQFTPKFVITLENGVPKIHYNNLTNGSNIYTNSSSTLKANQWTHLAFVRDGSSNWTWYVNGASAGTGTNSTNITFSSESTYIGYGGESYFAPFTGYISDMRLVKGSALTISVPTAPLTAITNTSLLLKGTDASIIDKAQGSNILLVGSTNEAESPYSSGRSIGLTNAHSTYVEITKQDEFLLGDTFTIEGWAKPTSLSNGYNTIFTGNGYGYYLAIRSNGGLNFYSTNSGTPNYDTASGVITNNTWHYIAAVCSSGTLTLYSGTSSSNFAARGHGSGGAENSVSGFDLNNFGSQFNGNTRFGVTHVSSQGFAGYLTDWRFSKGKARTVTFPSVPLKG